MKSLGEDGDEHPGTLVERWEAARPPLMTEAQRDVFEGVTPGPRGKAVAELVAAARDMLRDHAHDKCITSDRLRAALKGME